jgi:hypothetical protein
MPVQIINPLREKECTDCDLVLQSVPAIKATIEACEECGMEMSEETARIDAQNTFATAVKRRFNPLAQ